MNLGGDSTMDTVIKRTTESNATVLAPREPVKTSKRPLEPVERLSEILFGLIMVLTFTCSISVTELRLEEVNSLLVAAIGCNLAWGIIDAFMYLLACFVERGRGISALRTIHQTTDPQTACGVIAAAMPPLLASAMPPATFEEIRKTLSQLPDSFTHKRISKQEWLGSIAVFLAVFLSTFPAVVPFLLIKDAGFALRISNGVAVLMLFLTGYALGHHAGYHPWKMGVWMALVGSTLVALTIALGG
jgi:VIT family